MLEVGTRYQDIKGNSRLITKIENRNKDRIVFYTKNNNTTVDCYCSESFFIRNYTKKPLDQAFAKLDEQFKPECKHKNTRKDSFFSAMVYITCNDCGKALN